MKTVKDLLNENKLPVNDKCYESDNSYVIAGISYSLSMSGAELKERLTERKKDAPDFKALSHALRAGYQLKEIYETGDLKYPLKDREFLLAVKQGKLDFTTEVQPVLERVVEEVEKMSTTVDLPAKVDRNFWNQFIADVYAGKYND